MHVTRLINEATIVQLTTEKTLECNIQMLHGTIEVIVMSLTNSTRASREAPVQVEWWYGGRG